MNIIGQKSAAECRSIYDEIYNVQLGFLTEANRSEDAHTKRSFAKILGGYISKVEAQLDRISKIKAGFEEYRKAEKSWIVDGEPYGTVRARICARIENCVERATFENKEHRFHESAKEFRDEPRIIGLDAKSLAEWLGADDRVFFSGPFVLRVPKDGDEYYVFKSHKRITEQEVAYLAADGIEVVDHEGPFIQGTTIFHVARDDPHGSCTGPADGIREVPFGLEDSLRYPTELLEYNLMDFGRIEGCDPDFASAFNRCGFVMYKTIDFLSSLLGIADVLETGSISFSEDGDDTVNRDAEESIARALNASEERYDAMTKDFVEFPEFSCSSSNGTVTATAIVPWGLDEFSVERLAEFGFEVTKVEDLSKGSAIARVTCSGPDDRSLDSDVPHGYWGWNVDVIIRDEGLDPEETPWIRREIEAGNQYIGSYLPGSSGTGPRR